MYVTWDHGSRRLQNHRFKFESRCVSRSLTLQEVLVKGDQIKHEHHQLEQNNRVLRLMKVHNKFKHFDAQML